jgi:hypothetical protein
MPWASADAGHYRAKFMGGNLRARRDRCKSGIEMETGAQPPAEHSAYGIKPR